MKKYCPHCKIETKMVRKYGSVKLGAHKILNVKSRWCDECRQLLRYGGDAYTDDRVNEEFTKRYLI